MEYLSVFSEYLHWNGGFYCKSNSLPILYESIQNLPNLHNKSCFIILTEQKSQQTFFLVETYCMLSWMDEIILI